MPAFYEATRANTMRLFKFKTYVRHVTSFDSIAALMGWDLDRNGKLTSAGLPNPCAGQCVVLAGMIGCLLPVPHGWLLKAEVDSRDCPLQRMVFGWSVYRNAGQVFEVTSIKAE